MSTSAPRSFSVRYSVPAVREDWTLSEEPMPESQPHDLVLDLLKLLPPRVGEADRAERAGGQEPRRPLE
jgi:hypothetical protein